jgi:hypothetical protein
MGAKNRAQVHEDEFQSLKTLFATQYWETDADVEKFARAIHEINRDLVNNHPDLLITHPTSPYIEWDDLTPDQKKGRLFIARRLIEQFAVIPKQK